MALDPLPRQRLAIEAPPGPVLVIAGPGAGKTFCLIARINHLVGTLGVAPERICAVTFTNRAAEEIALRLKHTLRDRGDAITRGTIHALCLALLRERSEEHTSELQSRLHLVCRLLLEKKKQYRDL